MAARHGRHEPERSTVHGARPASTRRGGILCLEPRQRLLGVPACPPRRTAGRRRLASEPRFLPQGGITGTPLWNSGAGVPLRPALRGSAACPETRRRTGFRPSLQEQRRRSGDAGMTGKPGPRPRIGVLALRPIRQAHGQAGSGPSAAAAPKTSRSGALLRWAEPATRLRIGRHTGVAAKPAQPGSRMGRQANRTGPDGDGIAT